MLNKDKSYSKAEIVIQSSVAIINKKENVNTGQETKVGAVAYKQMHKEFRGVFKGLDCLKEIFISGKWWRQT